MTSEVPTSLAGLKASIELDSEISNSFLEVVQMGLDKLDVDICGLLGEAKIDADPANAANPPDELVFKSRTCKRLNELYIKENLQMALGLMDVLGEQLLVGASPRQWVQ